MRMNSIIATYRIVTPMFLGGADPTAEPEPRLPSFKGALRFWWRALQWGRVRDVAELRRKEAELFGSSETGQSRIQLSAAISPYDTLKAGKFLGRAGGKGIPKRDIAGDGVRYLGYGLIQAFDAHDKETGQKTSEAGKLTRPCTLGGFSMEVGVRFTPGWNEERDRKFQVEVIAALKLLGLCGGLGSRTRRGFGSLTLTKLKVMGQDDWQAPITPAEWEASLKTVLGKLPDNNALPEWTSFSRGRSRAVVVQEERGKAPLETLDRLGRDFVFFRSWGKNGKVLGLPREGNFKDDHDLMRSPEPRDWKAHPRRIVFGLPHNYGNRPKDQVRPADPHLERRASPLFFHIHQRSDETPPLGIVLFLPARFLPKDRGQISVGGHPVPLAHDGDGDFWQPALDFLKRLQSESGKEKFMNPRFIEI